MPIVPPPQPATALDRVASDRSAQGDAATRSPRGRWLAPNPPPVTDWQELKFDVVLSNPPEAEENPCRQLRLRLAENE